MIVLGIVVIVVLGSFLLLFFGGFEFDSLEIVFLDEF